MTLGLIRFIKLCYNLGGKFLWNTKKVEWFLMPEQACLVYGPTVLTIGGAYIWRKPVHAENVRVLFASKSRFHIYHPGHPKQYVHCCCGIFYTPPLNSGRVLWFHVGLPCICHPSVSLMSIRPSIFLFLMITWVNISGFSSDLYVYWYCGDLVWNCWWANFVNFLLS